MKKRDIFEKLADIPEDMEVIVAQNNLQIVYKRWDDQDGYVDCSKALADLVVVY